MRPRPVRLPAPLRSGGGGSAWLDDGAGPAAWGSTGAAGARRASPVPSAEEAPGACDVCVVGGGMLGLWTAHAILDRAPGTRVVVLEAGAIGEGASGRNGGFALSWWGRLGGLVARAGRDEAAWLAERSSWAVAELGRRVEERGLDAGLQRPGWLWAATTDAGVREVEDTAALADALGGGAHLAARTAAQCAELAGPAARAGARTGALDPDALAVQPARLVGELARTARARGARVLEGRRVVAVRPGAVEHRAAHDAMGGRSAGSGGVAGRVGAERVATLRAQRVVLAAGPWMSGIPALRRLVLPVSSDALLTEPVPELLEADRWTDGPSISEARTMLAYLRPTADGRVLLGVGGGALARAGHVGRSLEHVGDREGALRIALRRWLGPGVDGVPLRAWTGPVDRTADGVPWFGALDRDRRVLFGVGFGGNGVAPTLLGGELLAALALDRDEPLAASALVRRPPPRLPVEPARTLGGRLVREAASRAEAAEIASRPIRPLAHALHGLMPGHGPPPAAPDPSEAGAVPRAAPSPAHATKARRFPDPQEPT